MLGHYDHFPKTIHGSSCFVASTSTKKMQETLMKTLLVINDETFKLEDITYPTIPRCTVIFEFGIADGNGFNYLNEEETKKSLKLLRKAPFETMDFLCDIRYYRNSEEKKTALRFDYYMLRFIFDPEQMEIRISHEKGPRRVTPDDFIHFIAKRINNASSKEILKTL
jgi:hypothetical protein